MKQEKGRLGRVGFSHRLKGRFVRGRTMGGGGGEVSVPTNPSIRFLQVHAWERGERGKEMGAEGGVLGGRGGSGKGQ